MGELAVLCLRVEGLAAGEPPPTGGGDRGAPRDHRRSSPRVLPAIRRRPRRSPSGSRSLLPRSPALDVADELGALRAQLEELAARPRADEALPARVEELGRSVEALTLLAEASSGAEGLHDALAGLSARLDEGAAGSAELAAAVQAVEERLEATAGRLDEGAESTALSPSSSPRSVSCSTGSRPASTS